MRLTVLHLSGQRQQAFQPLRVQAGLAEREAVAENLAATRSGLRLSRGDLPPEGIAPPQRIFHSRLPQRCAGVGRCGLGWHCDNNREQCHKKAT